MKKILAIFVMIFAVIAVKAQINLEYTFPTSSVYAFNTSNNTYYSILYSTGIKIYNSDYSLYKFIPITPPDGYKISLGAATYFSDKVFNTDSKIEFLINFTLSAAVTVSTFNLNAVLQLYNEDGQLLKDFGTAMALYGSVFKQISGVSKLQIAKTTYDSSTSPATYVYSNDIYSLSGSLPSGVVELSDANLAPAYPNPSNSIVNLSVPKNIDGVAKMRIFNTGGKLIEEKQVDGLFDKVLLNVSTYPAGIYIYECNKVSNRFIVN